MNTVLWVLQVILSIKFISVAFTHGIRHDKPDMQQGIEKMGRISRPILFAVAILTLLGAVGLIVPSAFDVFTWMTPLTAAVLAGLMLFSIVFHVNCRDEPKIIVSVILFAIAAFLAYGRWVISPL